MEQANPKSTAKIAGHPIHPMLIPFPIAGFVGTFVSDLVYWSTQDPLWASMSYYLLSAGLVMAALAAVAGLIDFFGDGRIRAHSAAWHHMIGNVIAVGLSLANWFVRGGPEAANVLPTGLIISAAVAVILLYTGWRGWELVYRHRTGIADESHTPPSAPS